MQNIVRLAAITLPAAIALSACATTAAAPLPDGSDVALGERAYVDGPIVQPVEVIEDSRCPMNARCVWAGRAVLSTRIYGPDFDETVPLVLGEPHALHGTSITLTSVTPEKMAGAEIPAPTYRFGFEGGQ